MELINYNDNYNTTTFRQNNYEHQLYLQKQHEAGYSLVVTLNGDGADKILNEQGEKIGYNYTNSTANGSAATVAQIDDNNNTGNVNYSSLILGIDPKGSLEAYNEGKANEAASATLNVITTINEDTSDNIKNISFELFSGAGNNGMKTIAEVGVEAQKSGLISSDYKVAITLNDSPIDIRLINAKLTEEEQMFLKENTTFLLVGDYESQQWPKFGGLPTRIYDNAVKMAELGYEVQYIEYDPSEEEKARYGTSWDHVGIDKWSKEHNLHLYHTGIVGEPNDFNSLDGKVHTFKLINDGEEIPEGYEIIKTVTNDDSTLLLCEKIGGREDLHSGNVGSIAGTAGDIIENNRLLVETFTNNLKICINRVSDSIKPLSITTDVTGIGEFINGYINSYNQTTQKLYSSLNQEALAIQSYSDSFETIDRELADSMNDIYPVDNYDPISEDEY